jgi:hypothetical protein
VRYYRAVGALMGVEKVPKYERQPLHIQPWMPEGFEIRHAIGDMRGVLFLRAD